MTTPPGTDERRRILEKVAAREMTPQEAASLIEELAGSSYPVHDPAAQDYPAEAITSIRVIGSFKTVQIQGDPTVAGAIADGEHRIRTDGGVMIFEEEEADPERPGYVLFGPRSRLRFSGRINGRKIEIGQGPDVPPVLRVRMNPRLPLQIDITAGTANVQGVDGAITANITAGSGRFEGVRAPVQASVDAGSLHVRGVFDRGDSSIRCTAGKVKVELEPGSNVRLRARATLGKVSLPGPEDAQGSSRDWTAIGAVSQSMTIGTGVGTLDLEATTGSVTVAEMS